MKSLLFSFVYLSLLILVACTTAEIPVATPPTLTVQTGATEGLASVTVTPPATKPLILLTGTATTLPPTLPPTATLLPTVTVTSESAFTVGRILFLWDQGSLSNADEPVAIQPRMGLYQVTPGTAPDNWQAESLLSNIYALPELYPSSDQTKLAFFVLEDTDGSGDLYGNDIFKIHVYNISNGSLIRLDNQKYADSLSWFPDSQSVIYPQNANIALSQLDGSPPELLTNYPLDPVEGEPYNYIEQLAGSPDGRVQALSISRGTGVSHGGVLPLSASNELSFFDWGQGHIISVTHTMDYPFSLGLKWSPDSRWLAFTESYNQGLSLINAETLEIYQVVEPPTPVYLSWSPNGQLLAFTTNNTLYLWDAESQTINELFKKEYVSQPAWSPDGLHIAVGTAEGTYYTVSLIDPFTGESQELLEDRTTGQVIWSPDGQWLLITSGQGPQGGLYVVHREGGEPYLVFDTTGYNYPGDIVWLP